MEKQRPTGGIVRTCNCHHPYQDKAYGKFQRVHTDNGKGSYTCTVCGTKK